MSLPEAAMEYKSLSKIERYKGIRLFLRLAAWRLPGWFRARPRTLDPRRMPDHLLTDIGLSRPRSAWEESVGFWRLQ
jgi:uncharacterized protein YjiS (DUF1127 family)